MKTYRENLKWELKVVKFIRSEKMCKKFPSPFKRGECYLCLGEIKNMPQHYAYIDQKTGKTYWGYHSDDFKELKYEDDDW